MAQFAGQRHRARDAKLGREAAITFEWSDWRNGLFWWIQSVYVDKRFRRTGVFRALYAHVQE